MERRDCRVHVHLTNYEAQMNQTGYKGQTKPVCEREVDCKQHGRHACCRVHLLGGSEVGSYLRLIDFLYHSILDLRGIKKKKNTPARF